MTGVTDPARAVALIAELPHTVGLAITTEARPEHAAAAGRATTTNKRGAFVLDPGALERANRDPHRAVISHVHVHVYDGTRTVTFDMREVPMSALEGLWARQLIAHEPRLLMQFLAMEDIFPRSIDSTMQLKGLAHGVRVRSDVADDDAVTPINIWEELASTQRSAGDAYARQRDAARVAAFAEMRGIGFDLDRHKQCQRAWKAERAAARNAFVAATGMEPSMNPAGIQEFLQTRLTAVQQRDWPRTEKGYLSTKGEDLGRIAHVPGIRPLIDLKRIDHLITCFGASLRNAVNPVTGRLHPRINIAGAKSGRAAVSDPPLQQIPTDRRAPGLRGCVVAAPGCLLVGGDYSQMELRAAAIMSGDERMLQAFETGEDLHEITAAAIAGVDLQDVTPEQRSAAKAVNFGALYGSGPLGIVNTAWKNYGIEMTEEGARGALDAIASRYPGLHRHLRDHAEKCQRDGVVEIYGGRQVRVEWEKDGITYPRACNWPIQGRCADATMAAMVKLDAALRDHVLGHALVLQVHDELILEIQAPFAELAADLLKTAMVEGFLEIFPGATTRDLVEVKTGMTWADLK